MVLVVVFKKFPYLAYGNRQYTLQRCLDYILLNEGFPNRYAHRMVVEHFGMVDNLRQNLPITNTGR